MGLHAIAVLAAFFTAMILVIVRLPHLSRLPRRPQPASRGRPGKPDGEASSDTLTGGGGHRCCVGDAGLEAHVASPLDGRAGI